MTTRTTDKRSKTVQQQGISVASAAKSGDSLATLVALRDALAQAVDECRSKRDRAALSARLITVLDTIEARSKRAPSRREEIAAKRAQRRAAAFGVNGALDG